MRTHSQALLLAAALLAAPCAASATQLEVTASGVIYASEDDSNVFGYGTGGNTVTGQRATLMFRIDLDRAPPDLFKGTIPLQASFRNEDASDTVNGIGTPGGSWISSTATIGTSTVVSLIHGAGSYNNDSVNVIQDSGASQQEAWGGVNEERNQLPLPAPSGYKADRYFGHSDQINVTNFLNYVAPFLQSVALEQEFEWHLASPDSGWAFGDIYRTDVIRTCETSGSGNCTEQVFANGFVNFYIDTLTARVIPVAPDIDSDGVADKSDNCPVIPNPGQTDTNADGYGDACVDPTVKIPRSTSVDSRITIGPYSIVGAGATIRAGSRIGTATTVGRGVTAGPSANIGNATTISQGTVVGVSTLLGDGVVIGKSVSILERARIGDATQIGQGSVICPGAVVGASAVLGKNVFVQSNAVVPDGARLASGRAIPTSASCSR